MIHAAMTLHTWLTFCAHRKRIYAYFFQYVHTACIDEICLGKRQPTAEKTESFNVVCLQ